MTAIEEQFVAAARAQGAELGAGAEAFMNRLDRYSNLPGLVKGVVKLEASDALTQVASQVVQSGPTLLNGKDSGAYSMTEWALIALASRMDPGVFDRIPESDREHVARSIRGLRKGLAPQPVKDAAVLPDAPLSASKVSAWLKAHPTPDVTVLSPYAGQKAPARAAAIRALGHIGTPQAFDVLAKYASEEYARPIMAELHRAWPSFDRNEFARTMLIPHGTGWLDLDVTPDLHGVAAIDGLRTLKVIIGNGVDLSPLAECAGLRSLTILFMAPGAQSFEWIESLRQLRDLDISGPISGSDLTPLANTAVSSLRISLDGSSGAVLSDMAQLKSLTLSGQGIAEGRKHAPADPALTEVVLDLARRGLRVRLYAHEKPWIGEVINAAESSADLVASVANGFVELGPT